MAYVLVGHNGGVGGVLVQRSKGASTFSDVARALLEAPDRYKDKTYRSYFQSLLYSLYLYEYYPCDVVSRLLPCLELCSKNLSVMRSLLYVVQRNASRGHSGTPTLLEHSGTTFAPDASTLKREIEFCYTLAQSGIPAIKRYALYTVAASARQDGSMKDVLQQVLVEMIKAVDEADKKVVSSDEPASATDWDLQHSVYGSLRISGVPAATHPIAGACFIGISSPDPVGARHALALAEEIALKSPNVVQKELGPFMESVISVYDEQGPSQCVPPGCLMNISDVFSRAHLARICAYLINSDQGSLDPSSQAGMLFWRMLTLLISRDESDLVRFAALNALSGHVVLPSETSLGSTSIGKSRDDAVVQQRRARAWRTLVSQSAVDITVPGVSESKSIQLKFIDLIGRLILLALSKPVRKARFTAAASVVTSLAKSCLASNISGGNKQNTSSELDRVMNILAKEMSNLIESPISGGQRAACIEALLYLQAAGFPVVLSASSFTLVGADGGSGGAQDSLLVAVLRCARSCPGDAPLFLEYASGVVGIAPEAVDLKKVVALWNAACDQENSSAGKNAALVAALSALRSPLPPSALSIEGASYYRALSAARSDAGWTSFVATAAWWLGDMANTLCGERSGVEVKSILLAANATPNETDDDDDLSSDDDGLEQQKEATVNDALDAKTLIDAHLDRIPSLSIIISALNDIILGGNWQLRAAAARAIGKIAIRSGEPYRLQCYGILVSVSTGAHGQDSLGLHGVVKPVIRALDEIYGSQAVIEKLWSVHGEDVDEWPHEILESIHKRSLYLNDLVEKTVCTLPKSNFDILGLKAAKICAQYEGDDDSVAMELADQGDRSGVVLKTSKNKEIEDILSFGGTEDSFNFVQKFEKRENKDSEIESLLTREDASNATWDALAQEQRASDHPSNAFGNNNHASDSEFSPKSSGYHGRLSSGRVSLDKVPCSQGVMLHTFIAAPDHPEELSIFEGDVVDVLDLGQEGWALVKDSSGHQGLVPRSYVNIDSPSSPSKKNTYSADPINLLDIEDSLFQNPSNIDSYADPMFSSGAGMSQGMPSGQPWEAATQDLPEESQNSPLVQQNISPSNPFEDYKPTSRPYTSHRRSISGLSGNQDFLNSPKTPSSPSTTQAIVAPFQGEMEGELTVEKGDMVRVISDAGGWSKVIRLSDQQTGLIPTWAVGSK